MQAALEAHAALLEALRHALGLHQLKLYVQMQADSTRRIVGAEMLLRWKHPQRGLVSPVDFIPLAEESGLIVPIGLWVLETACAQLKMWAAQPLTRELQLAVNVSARQFRQPDFLAQVRRGLELSGADPTRLTLELTESVLLDDVEYTIAMMQALKSLGVRFSMDDFGTGYSSLSYLRRLPLDQLKIDRSFVLDIDTNPNDAVIVQTIIGMAKNLRLEVLAEGVETEEQLEFLTRHGCFAFQGSLFSPPLPVAGLRVVGRAAVAREDQVGLTDFAALACLLISRLSETWITCRRSDPMILFGTHGVASVWFWRTCSAVAVWPHPVVQPSLNRRTRCPIHDTDNTYVVIAIASMLGTIRCASPLAMKAAAHRGVLADPR